MRGFLNDMLALARGRDLPSQAPEPPPARLTSQYAQKPEILTIRLRALDISQSQFSAITGVTPRTVSNWVSGRTRMSGAAELVLKMLEDHGEVRRALGVGVNTKGAPRGKPFAAGNPYRFGDRRRRVAVAGAQMARAAA